LTLAAVPIEFRVASEARPAVDDLPEKGATSPNLDVEYIIFAM
jgi:hypothetical protein